MTQDNKQDQNEDQGKSPELLSPSEQDKVKAEQDKNRLASQERDLERNNVKDAESKDPSASTRVSPTNPGAKIPGQTVFPHGDPKAPPKEEAGEAGERAVQSEAVRQNPELAKEAVSTAPPLDTGYPGHTTPAVHNPKDGKLHGQEHDRLESQRVMHENPEMLREQREMLEAQAKSLKTREEAIRKDREGLQTKIADQKNLETESPTKSPLASPTSTPTGPVGPSGPGRGK